MVTIGYHASHEQFAPSQLLVYAKSAERAGFNGAMCSDHFHPWSERQGESGFSWSWLGAAMQATSLSYGLVCAPGQRYNPAIVAQAAATLSELFPGRLWVSVGSGEALNEHITGDRWPPKSERNARLKEAVEIMRALWAGETVNHRGLVTVEEAKLYTRPPAPPLIIGAAITAETARWFGGWADGLITATQPSDKLAAVVEAFREGGGEGKPIYLQVKLSYAATDEEARHGAHHQWAMNILPSPVLADLRMPREFDAVANHIQPHDLDGQVRISSDLERHIEWLHQDLELGFDRLYLHNVNRDQDQFIQTFGERVLPAFIK